MRCVKFLAGPVLILGSLVTPAVAQDTDDVQELQRVIELQQRQLEAQQKQLEDFQKTLEAQTQLMQELQAQIESLATAETQEEAPESRPQRSALISQRDKHDLESPTASTVTYFEGGAAAFIPGSETEVSVHGQVELQVLHDTVGINKNKWDTFSIPVEGGPSQTKFSLNPTQFAVSSVTPVSDGRLNTWLSIDMGGQTDIAGDPRMRIAFGEYVNDRLGLAVLAGQTYSTMLDLRAVPETFDFATPAGIWQTRQPVVRVSKSLTQSVSAEVSVETPENVIYTDALTRTRWPDLVAAVTWNIAGDYLKHLRLAGMARDLRAEGSDGSTDSVLGWSVSGSTKLGLPFLGSRDNLKLTLHYGNGPGTQVKGGPVEGVFHDSELHAIGVLGAYGGIQHFWSERFRSNLVIGYSQADNPDFVEGQTLKNTTYGAANFVWTPFPTATFGFEYLWGRREEEDGESGTSSRYLFTTKLLF